MNGRYISEIEINQHQQNVRIGAYRARNAFTISGVRQLLGNTFIAIGMGVHGRSETCRETLSKKPGTMPAHGV